MQILSNAMALSSVRRFERCRPKGLSAVLLGVTLASLALTARADAPALYVYSTIDALLAGTYDGELTVRELLTKGDFGLGTFNHLDGEMLVLGGVAYHMRADGSVSVADAAERTPLAYVVRFRPTLVFDVSAEPATPSLAAIEERIDARLANKNLFYAVQVKGRFTGLSTRAIAAQVRPYKPLAELVKTQVIFNRDAVGGTLVGLRSPPVSKGISVPGWHWHFISDDKSYGGHVLAAGLTEGAVQVAGIHRFDVDFPETEDFADVDQARDRSDELHQVENARSLKPAPVPRPTN